MPEFVFFRRGEEVLRFALDRPRTIVGRGEQCDIVLPDPNISRQQFAVVETAEHRYQLEDLSGKKTTVGGELVEKANLRDGADVSLGQWTAIFREKTRDAPDLPTRGLGTQTHLQDVASVDFGWQGVQLRIRQRSSETLHKLAHETITIGKDVSCDIPIEDKFVSAKHLKITRTNIGFHISDHHSTNGTYVGGLRIYEADIPLFTSIRIGETELTLELTSDAKKESGSWGIIGRDPAIRQLLDLIERVAPSSATISIFGESGTGKELVARAIHLRSNRKDRAFIPINCAAISRELIESELFGHEKGAFTGALGFRKGAFEEADGGTLFLDEIGELPLELQPKLLRALESGEIKRVGAARPTQVDVRIVAATNRDLLAAARGGKFREDLYYRLSVIPLHLAPLRNRRNDIVAIAEHFLRIFSPKGQLIRFTPSATDRLVSHSWPGNVRELRNAVHRALLLRKGAAIDASDLSFDPEKSASLGNPSSESEAPVQHVNGMSLQDTLDQVERQIIEKALRRHNFNRERVAAELGVARSTLFKRLKRWGLSGDGN